jgi:serine/threonine protein kinase
MKPANVMVVDGTDLVKLIDFGIARFFKPGKLRDTIELGTDGYAPPEQYGKSQTDERADIYALGAMLHQLLTLRDPITVPFKFPRVRSLNPMVSRRVDKAIAEAVQSVVDKRHRSVAEMKTALLGDGGLSVTPRAHLPRRQPSPSKPSRRSSISTKGGLRADPTLLDFGAVRVGGNAPHRSVRLDVPSGSQISLSTDVVWLHVQPRTIDRSGDVSVLLFPRSLPLGRRTLKGWWWFLWPVRFLVPLEQKSIGHVLVKAKGKALQVPVNVVAVPSVGRLVLGWIGTVLLALVVYSLGLVLLLSLVGSTWIA